MRKIISIILSIVMISSCLFSIPTQAVTIDLNNYTAIQMIEKYPKIAETIVDGLTEYSDEINVKEFSVTQKVMVELYKSVLVENPEIFYVNPYSVKCKISSNTGNVVSIVPVYAFNKKDIPEKIKAFNKKIEAYISKVEDSWSEYKKCRFIHDLIINNCEYDVDYNNGEIDSRSAYGVFFDKVAVCQGYTLAYNLLLNKLGIEAHFVESYTVNHAWSIVKIKNKFYHVDVTWDDPTEDLTGRTLHSYFLISDNKLTQLEPIRKWHSNMKASDTSYDNAWWSDIRTVIYTIDNKDYYIDQNYTDDGIGALMCYNESKKTHTCLYKIKDRWYENSEKKNYWQGGYSNLAYDGELLYFNTPTGVYSIKTNGSDVQKCYTNPHASWKPIYGLAYQLDNVYRVEIQNTPMSKDGAVSTFSPKYGVYEDDSNVSGNLNNISNQIVNSSSNKTTTKKKVIVTPVVTIKGLKKKITVKYKKISNATGFQVKYKFKSNTVTINCKAKKTVTKTIKNLKKGTYKVYVRAYAKQGNKTYYSSWTKAKSVKVK